MSRLIAARGKLETALTGGGLRVGIGQRFAAPAVVIEPGDPWAEHGKLAGCLTSRWRVWAIAGKADTAGAYEALGELIDTVDTALVAVAGASRPTWQAPTDYAIGNVPYAASVAEITLETDKLGGT